jgi:hypothetical protein
VTNQDLTQRAEQIRTSQPASPAELERKINQANDLYDALVEALQEVNKRRYEAEVTYSQQKHTRMTYWIDAGKNVTYARSMAEVEAREQYEAWLNTKAEYHYLEDLGKALNARIMSMLNINKHVSAAYNSYRGGA